VNVTGPEDIPVTTPELVTDATPGLLLTQVPPVDGDRAVVLFTHRVAAPETTGKAFTVTFPVVLLHPVEVWVKVKLALPDNIPVTTPALVTEATEGVLLIHVPPVVGDNRVVPLTQIADDPVILTTGLVYTVTFVGNNEVTKHPCPSVIITE
jgi:hypothetical protein